MCKKLVLFLVAVCCVMPVAAQEAERTKGTETKKGYNVLPVKGDFAIGADATPFLQYGINLFNGGNAPEFGYNGSIFGKYYVRDNQAVRFRLKIGVTSQLVRTSVMDDNDPENPNPSTSDSQETNQSSGGLYGGYEWRRGYGRLQAFFGGEAGIDFFSEKINYKYGNAMTPENPAPTNGYGFDPTERPLNQKLSNGFGFGLGGFAGVEFFFARKMSIGGQVGFNLAYSSAGKSTTTYESYNATTGRVEKMTRASAIAGWRVWDFSTNLSGNIFLMFHF